ncbi:MAG: hypothetical protein ACI9VT_003392 [Psychroserpens sp.]|jgi:hypothetical protein
MNDITNFTLSKKWKTELENQFKVWKRNINLTLAPLVLVFVVPALMSPTYRSLLSFLGIIALIGGFLCIKDLFPKIIKDLREKERSYTDDIIYRGISSYYFGFFRSFKDFPIYWISIILLIACLADVPSSYGI